jgi:chromosome segregation ATPase
MNMKRILIGLVAAALTLTAALPASAHARGSTGGGGQEVPPGCTEAKQRYQEAIAAYKDENRKIAEVNDRIFAIRDELAGLSVDIAKAKERVRKAKSPAKVAAAKAKLKRLKAEQKELEAKIPPLEDERDAALARRDGHEAEANAAADEYGENNCDSHLGPIDS